MPLITIFPQVHALALGPVNVFLIEDGAKLTLIDTGYVGNHQPILDAVQSLGKQPGDISNIVLTHCHPDHAGSLAALKQQTSAIAWMHTIDAEVVRGNTPMHRSTPSPGILNQILYQLLIKNSAAQVPAAIVDHEVADGEILPISGGVQVIYTPGHSAGHIALLLQRDGGLLFAGDTCSNMTGLGYSIVYDDLNQGRQSLANLAGLSPHTICFGHGRILTASGIDTFKRKWRTA